MLRRPFVVAEADRLAHSLVDELQALARGVGKMRRPVEIGLGQGRRRKSAGEVSNGGVQRAFGDVRERRDV
jgi:hypothetical protein